MIRDFDPVARGWGIEELDTQRYEKQEIDQFEALSLVLNRIRPGSHVLDVGCADGSFSKMIAHQKAASVVGIESHPGRANVAKERGLDVREGLFSEESVKGLGLFDAVLFTDVLEHMTSPYDALQIARSILRPDGRVIASIPNVAHWSVRVALLSGKFAYASHGLMDATHLRWFTRDTILTLFRSAGFEVTAIEGTAGLWTYRTRQPWRLVGRRVTRRLVVDLVKRAPALFSYQFVVEAKVL